MNELFEKLLNTELLNEQNKTELKEQFQKALTEAIEQAKKDATDKVRVELAEQFAHDKEALVEALDTKIAHYLNEHYAQFSDEIQKYRDQETRYAEQLFEEKSKFAETVKNDMATLVERLDSFLEERLKVEFTELRESIEVVKQNETGKRMFEAFAEIYGKEHFGDNKLAESLKKVSDENDKNKRILESLQTEVATLKREKEMNKVLESLQGKSREVMSYVLKAVPTEKLTEEYNKIIGRVIHESVSESKPEKENSKVLAENKQDSLDTNVKIVTGDKKSVNEEKSSEINKDPALTKAIFEAKLLAGLAS